MAQPQYRRFDSPPRWTRDGSRANDTDSWIEWLVEERLIHDFLPAVEGTCHLCGSPVTQDASGRYWSYCFHCNQARRSVDVLVVGSYSLDNGLESLIKSYKDFDKGWTVAPVATLLWEMLGRHGDCLRRAAGENAVFTWVPPDNPDRTFDHIEKLFEVVQAPNELGWRSGVIRRNRSAPRPGPRRDQTFLNADAYDVVSDVRGKTVVLLDDLWTSGSSMASSAAALKAAGALEVIGVVLGRQLQRGSTYGEAERVFNTVEGRGWDFSECTLCA
jgi:predicted amidophosphoribosyltransferase